MDQRIFSYLTGLLKKPGDVKICKDTLLWIKLNPQYARVVLNIAEPFIPTYLDYNEISGREVMPAEDQCVTQTFNRFLAVINNAKIHTSSGYIQLSTGEILLETAWIEENILGNKKYFDKFKRKELVKPGKWFSILLYWCENYYHWFCDVLPRLHRVINHLPPDMNFIVPANMEPWKLKSLEAIGISSNKCVSFNGSIPWKLEELYYTPPVTMTGDIEKDSIKWVRSKLVSVDSNENDSKKDRIFISRKKALKRRIVNENLLCEFLMMHNFKTVIAEDYSIEEQVEIFKKASFVVAPHGAGLTNLLYCSPGTKVLEIFDPTAVRRCYRSLSSSLDLSYACYLGDHVDIALKGEGDISIDIDHFKANFDNWLTKD